jgi:hypothetical protein
VTRRRWLVLAAALGVLFALGALWVRLRPALLHHAGRGASIAVAPASTPQRTRRGGLDLTFLVFSDTHLGFDSRESVDGGPRDAVRDPDEIDRVNQRAIVQMNGIAGRPWPAALGGTIARPRALVLTGDLTEDGDPWQWTHFVQHYGLRGGDGLLAYPVFENHGNHDKHHSWYVLDRIKERHGSTRYVVDWLDLHLVCLGEGPDDDDLAWLAQDLESIGHERPVILAFHYPLMGPFSTRNWFGDGNYRPRLAKLLASFNVIAILHGHYHHSGRYEWRGFDVYKAGSAKHDAHSFLVIHVSDERLRVASWQFTQKSWEWWDDKPINGSRGPRRSGGTRDDQGLFLAPRQDWPDDEHTTAP